jgi:hypothetical protein
VTVRLKARSVDLSGLTTGQSGRLGVFRTPLSVLQIDSADSVTRRCYAVRRSSAESPIGVAILTRRGTMRRRILVAVLAMLFTGMTAAAAGAAEQHPPKFGVHDTNCSATPNQPHCPGNH